MVVVRSVERKADIYGSPNLKDWTHLSEFGDLANVKWVMVVDLNPGSIAGGSGGHYFVGDFGGTTFTSDEPATYTPPAGTVIQDFEEADFGSWTSTGAFGPGPADGEINGQQTVTGFAGEQLANSFHDGDATVGTLPSPEFTVNRAYLNFLVGGGNHPHVPSTRLGGEPPEGTLLFDGFEFPDGTNLEEAGWSLVVGRWSLTGDFVADRNPSTSGGEGAIGQKRLNTWKAAHGATTTRCKPSSWLPVRSSTARPARTTASSNWKNWDVRACRGQEAVLWIEDHATGGVGTPDLRPSGARADSRVASQR